MDTTLKESAITPTLGEVKPIDISSHGRRETDEKTVTDLVKALARDGGFLHPITVWASGPGTYLLVAGAHRLEAWKRHFGEQAPISAIIYPPHTPDPRITMLKIEENLFRKELDAAERTAQEMRWAAAFKKLNGGKPVTPVTGSGEAAETGNLIPSLARACGGRGNKGMAQQIADKVGIGKRAVNMRRQSAAAVIGEEIHLDLDTPEELERKAAKLEREADKRQRAEAKVVRLKRRKPEPRGATEDPTQPAKLRAADIGSKIEDLWKALDAIGRFDAIARKEQLRLIHKFCLGLGLDPPKMARPAAFGLVEEEPELAVDLPAEVVPTTDDAPGAHAEHPVDAADVGAEDLQDADEDVSEAADQEPGGATKCAYCTMEFYSSDERVMIHGRLYHADLCAKFAKPPIAIAA